MDAKRTYNEAVSRRREGKMKNVTLTINGKSVEVGADLLHRLVLNASMQFKKSAGKAYEMGEQEIYRDYNDTAIEGKYLADFIERNI